ncbi:uncharacterized protein LOC141601755 [Silene latifolia]|uniref:uncharacterized protein LOC141601755 n=1 Tax=Silene latifolia TaxID=37657 RepID=UPI003D77E517
MAGYVGVWWLQPNQDYTITSGYNWLSPPMVKVNWDHFVWVKEALPKHSFIGWLVMHERLLTRDRLKKMGIILDDTCILCDAAPESHSHLFFNCMFSQRFLHLLSQRLGCHLPRQSWIAWWLSMKSQSQSLRNSIAAHLLALIYSIWWCRNKCRIEGYLLRPDIVVASLLQGRLLTSV